MTSLLRCLAVVAGLVAGLVAGVAQAQNSTVTVQATGYGVTETEALSDALAQAAAQVNGANVSIDTQVRSTAVEASASNSLGASARFEASVRQSQSAGFQADGQIAAYRVLSTTRESGTVKISVEADVLKYQEPGAGDTRRRMALLPVRAPQASYDFFGALPGAELARDLSAQLEQRLVQSHRFSILDRSTLGASVAELALIASDLSGPAEQAKLRRVKGADYLLLPTVRSASDRLAGAVNPATGQRDSFRFELELRVIVPATAEVKFSQLYTLKKAKDREHALAELSQRAVADLVEKIYPARVVSVSGSTLILSTGGAGVAVGDRYAIFAEGEALKDPDSGADLGRVETRIATATVSRNDAKLSYLTLDHEAAVAVGMLARREQNPAAPPPAATSGVRLPFDR